MKNKQINKQTKNIKKEKKSCEQSKLTRILLKVYETVQDRIMCATKKNQIKRETRIESKKAIMKHIKKSLKNSHDSR